MWVSRLLQTSALGLAAWKVPPGVVVHATILATLEAAARGPHVHSCPGQRNKATPQNKMKRAGRGLGDRTLAQQVSVQPSVPQEKRRRRLPSYSASGPRPEPALTPGTDSTLQQTHISLKRNRSAFTQYENHRLCGTDPPRTDQPSGTGPA